MTLLLGVHLLLAEADNSSGTANTLWFKQLMVTESGTFVQPKCMRLCLNFNLCPHVYGMNLTQPLRYKFLLLHTCLLTSKSRRYKTGVRLDLLNLFQHSIVATL